MGWVILTRKCQLGWQRRPVRVPLIRPGGESRGSLTPGAQPKITSYASGIYQGMGVRKSWPGASPHCSDVLDYFTICHPKKHSNVF